MITKDSIHVFNIVIDLDVDLLKDEVCIADFTGVNVFWDASTELALDLLQYGFVVDSLEYHEYDPSMLCVIKSHQDSDPECKVEFRFRASDKSEKLFSNSVFQGYWRSNFNEDFLPIDVKVVDCKEYFVTVNNIIQFKTIESAVEYICRELYKLSNTYIYIGDVPDSAYSIFDESCS